jgi:hypothetical protein
MPRQPHVYKHPVTLQISLAPSDYHHAHVLLQHQVRAWHGQYDELLITIDMHRSSGRFSARWEEGRELIVPLAESIPGARVVIVDYSSAAQSKVSGEFFGGTPVPLKDFRGGPYYSYFFALSEAKHDYVFHTDSDVFFGGSSSTWINEAIEHMASHANVLFAAPLPGPPHPDGSLLTLEAKPDAHDSHSFIFEAMSTRLFLMDRDRFRTAVGALKPRRPSLRSTVIALLEGNPAQDLPEHLFTSAMSKTGLVRRDFLGKQGGRWSLHPPYRCADFYEKLPSLVAAVERGEVPEAQRGCHDFNGSMVDWSEAYAALTQNRLWHRLLRKCG